MAKKIMYSAYRVEWSGNVTSSYKVSMGRRYYYLATSQDGKNNFVCSLSMPRPTIKGFQATFPANTLYVFVGGQYYKILNAFYATATRLPDSETPYTYTKGKCVVSTSGTKATLRSFVIDVCNVFAWEEEVPDPVTPDPENPDPENPDPENPDPENPDPVTPDPENPDPEPEKPDPSTPSVDVDYNFKERDMLIRANNEYVSVARIKVLDGSIVVTTNDNQTITLTTKKPVSEIHSLIFRALRMSPALLNLDGIA